MQCNRKQNITAREGERGRVVQRALESFPQSGFKVQEFARKLETQKVGNETQRVGNAKEERSKISEFLNLERTPVSEFSVEI